MPQITSTWDCSFPNVLTAPDTEELHPASASDNPFETACSLVCIKEVYTNHQPDDLVDFSFTIAVLNYTRGS